MGWNEFEEYKSYADIWRGFAKWRGKIQINKVSFTIYKYKSDRIHITGVKSISKLKYYKYMMENKYGQEVIEE